MNIAIEDIKFLEEKAKNETEVNLIKKLSEEGKTFVEIEDTLKWKALLRENGRWSLKHKIISEENNKARTACGWEYSLKLEQSVETDDMFRCQACLTKNP